MCYTVRMSQAGEYSVAAIGAWPIIAGHKRRATGADVSAILSTHQRMAAASRAVLRGSALTYQAARLPDTFERVVDTCQRFDWQSAPALELASSFVSDDGTESPVGAECIGTAANVAAYLATIAPRQFVSMPISGVRPRAPSHAEVTDFTFAATVALDPWLIYELARSGMLGTVHVLSVREVYPLWLAEAQAQMTDAIVSYLADDKSLTWRQERALSIFLGQPAMGMHDAIARGAEMDAQERQARSESRGGGGGRLSVDLRNLQTPTQRAEAR